MPTASSSLIVDRVVHCMVVVMMVMAVVAGLVVMSTRLSRTW